MSFQLNKHAIFESFKEFIVLDHCFKNVVFFLALMVLFGCGNKSSDPNVLRAAKAGYETFQTGDMEAWSKTQAADVQWKIPLGFLTGESLVVHRMSSTTYLAR